MHEISYVDETFDLNFASEYHLSIQVSLDGFSFCILDTVQKKYVLLKYFPLTVKKPQFLSGKLHDYYEKEEILNRHFKSVTISYAEVTATVVPSDFNMSGSQQLLFDLNLPHLRHEDTASNSLRIFSQDVVFTYPDDLRVFFSSKYPDYRFFHTTYPVLNAAFQQKGKAARTLVVEFYKKHFYLIFIEKDIRLFNSFYYKTETDFLYHTLHVCKKFGFDAEKDEIWISGPVAAESDFIRQLKKYILHVNFLKPDQDFHYSYTFGETPEHYFAGLFNSYKCAL